MFETRTHKSIRNGSVALVFSVILLVLGFFSRRIFIECLGIDLLGLNTTATDILGFLNLAELGIGASVSFALYVPLSKELNDNVNEIVAVQGWLYRRISVVVLFGAVCVMAFFPLIFADVSFPFWYVYASFGVYLLAALLGYWFNYQQIVLIADQREYKVTWCVQGLRSIKILVQIIGISQFQLGYEFWIITEIVAALITTLALRVTIRKTYTWLKPSISMGRELSKSYPDIIRKTKQLVFHRVSEYIIQHVSTIIVYAFVSLSVVAVYGNYMMLVMNITMLVGAVFNGCTASIGNLVAEGNKELITSFYRKYSVIRFWLASVLCFCFYKLSDDFITVWIGSQYVIDDVSFLFLTIYAFIATTRLNDQFIAAYGLYHDTWAPVTEAVLNIGLSVVFGLIWGLPGIIGGAVCGTFVIVCCWKPYFLFRQGFKLPVLKYLKLIALSAFVITIASVVSCYLYNRVCRTSATDMFEWFVNAAVTIAIYAIISTVLFSLFSRDFKKTLCALAQSFRI